MNARRHSIALGRSWHVKPQAVSHKLLVRAHMRKAGLNGREMAELIGMTHGGFRHWLNNTTRQTAPQYIDKIIEVLNIDARGALQLRLQAAIEQGWQLDALKEKLPHVEHDPVGVAVLAGVPVGPGSRPG